MESVAMSAGSFSGNPSTHRQNMTQVLAVSLPSLLQTLCITNGLNPSWDPQGPAPEENLVPEMKVCSLAAQQESFCSETSPTHMVFLMLAHRPQ